MGLRKAHGQGSAGAMLAALVGAALAGCATTTTRAPVEDRAMERPEAAAARPAAPPAAGSYTVRANDTLYSIAWRHDLDYKALAAANGIEAPYTIHPGRRLRLPAGGAGPAAQPPAPRATAAAPAAPAPTTRTRQQRQAASPRPRPVAAPPQPTPAVQQTTPALPRPRPAPVSPPAPKKPPVPATAKPAAPPKAPPPAKPLPVQPSSSAPAAVAGWQQPVSAKPVRAFGGASKGLDYALPPATRVRAAAPGVVVYAGPGLGGFRHLVIVKASERYLVAYGINVKPRLQEGETVAAGATVAEIGSGGAAAGKFHFEIRDHGKPVDPRPLVGGA